MAQRDRYLPAQAPTVASKQFAELVGKRAVAFERLARDADAERAGAEQASGDARDVPVSRTAVVDVLREHKVYPKPSTGWLGTDAQLAEAVRVLRDRVSAQGGEGDTGVHRPSLDGSSTEGRGDAERGAPRGGPPGSPARQPENGRAAQPDEGEVRRAHRVAGRSAAPAPA